MSNLDTDEPRHTRQAMNTDFQDNTNHKELTSDL